MASASAQGSFKGFEQLVNPRDVNQEGLTTDKKVSTNLQCISRNIQQLKKLVENLGTSRDSKDLRDRLKTTQTETNQLTKQTSDLLRRLEDVPPDDEKQVRQWKVQKQRLGETFHDLLKDYQEIQKQIRARERADIRESLQKSGCFDIDVDDSGSLVKNGQQIEVQAIQAAVDLDLIKEREKDLKQLEQDIVDIHDIFQQLGTMVHEQGEVLNKVEDNVDIAQDNVEAGVKELEEAEKNVDAARRKKLMLIVLIGSICVVVAVIITVIVVTSK